jgi:hypothetical protein
MESITICFYCELLPAIEPATGISTKVAHRAMPQGHLR